MRIKALAVVFITLSAFTLHGAQDKLNIIVVLVDDLGAMDLSCQGSRYYQTPHIDRLAQQGVRFTQAYAAAAICSPTRAALLTGLYPARIGITDWIRGAYIKQMRLPPLASLPGYEDDPKRRLACPANRNELDFEYVTLAELLKPAGYAAGYIGKWHLGDEGHWPSQQGFDLNLGGCDFGAPPSYFDPYTNPRQPNGIPGLKPRKPGEYPTDREADEAVKFIRDHKDRPFYLHLAHYAVHEPVQAKAELTRRYEQPGKTAKNGVYAAMVQSVDESMGRIMETGRSSSSRPTTAGSTRTASRPITRRCVKARVMPTKGACAFR